MEAALKKKLGILMSAALASTLVLSSCSSPTEEATIDTGIVERLNAATGFSWNVIPLSNYKLSENELKLYESNGYIQEVWPTSQMECLFGVYVFENEEYAKKGLTQLFPDDEYKDFEGFYGVIDDPLTNYGIILVESGEPCSAAAASTFDFVIPRKN
jgi:hypothetical protein